MKRKRHRSRPSLRGTPEENIRRYEFDQRRHLLPVEYTEPWWASECDQQPKVVPSPRDHKRSIEIPGIGRLPIDADLDLDWILSLNEIPGFRIVETNAGHDPLEGLPYLETEFILTAPYYSGEKSSEVRESLRRMFEDVAETDAWGTGGYGGFDHYPDRVVGGVFSYLPRIWMSECQVNAWWEQVIIRLHDWAATLRR